MPTEEKNSPKKKLPDSAASYMKYASMGTQMLIIIGLGVFGGYKIDTMMGNKVPIFTLILSLLSVGVAIYISIKDFLKKK
jgi:hypothetical protein